MTHPKTRAPRVARIAGLVLVLLTAVSGCSSPQKWDLTNITGVMPQLKFTLTDQDGKTLQASDLRGKIPVLYFGYTNCPDICPTTLATLAQALRKLGAEANAVRILFVSVDPARDTTAVLKSYVQAFGPQFIGLRGDQKELRYLTKRYRVTYGLGKADAHGNYEVSHSSAVFVFDRKGDVRLLGRGTDPAKSYTHDLKQLINDN